MLEEPPAVDLTSAMRSTWFGTKIRIEATIDSALYKEIQSIIQAEQKLAEEREWPEVPISNVVEMLLRKGVRTYHDEHPTK
jgi:hypothetical protein